MEDIYNLKIYLVQLTIFVLGSMVSCGMIMSEDEEIVAKLGLVSRYGSIIETVGAASLLSIWCVMYPMLLRIELKLKRGDAIETATSNAIDLDSEIISKLYDDIVAKTKEMAETAKKQIHSE